MYGVKLSRYTVRMFEQNDMQHLERLLQQVHHADEKRGKKPILNRRLSSTGYCFSASLPPLNAVSASTGIEIMRREGSTLFPKLHRNIKAMNSALTSAIAKANQSLKGRSFTIILGGHEGSVLRHFRLEGHAMDHAQLSRILAAAADTASRRGVAVAAASYLPLDDAAPAPSLRITCSCSISDHDVRAPPRLHSPCVAEV
jgi:7-keto-8-aminopelargonate synthetase-like enzyme